MKKLFTLLTLIITAFAIKSSAQTTNECNAAFDFTISNLSVKFSPAITSDLSANHSYWRFGDGTLSSDISPTHIYTSPGIYTVTHIFYKTQAGSANASCLDSVQKRIELTAATAPPPTCNADFDFSISNMSVKFTAASKDSGAAHHYWKFGDGTFSSEVSPSHIYSTAGNYSVTLYFYRTQASGGNALCIDSVTKHVELTAPLSTCSLHAKFSFEKDASQSNKINFTNLSTPTSQIHYTKWTFGDGTSSNDFNTNHVYATSGTYTVCLTVLTSTNTATGCHRDTCMQVQVTLPSSCNINPKFTWKTDTANSSKIYFTNASTDLTSNTKLEWFFGDNTSSTNLNPDHIYAHAGTYNVCLKATASTICFKYFCQVIEVKETEIKCDSISKFNFTRSTVNCLEFKFAPVNQNPNWKYVWSFGDGTGSTDITPSHVYPRSGNYTVFLIVYRSASCVSTSHKVAETGACFNCNNIWVKYEYRKESASSNKFFFHALSNYPILSQSFTIAKLNSNDAAITLTGISPDYIFTQPGDYRVCLRAVTSGNCVKEYCEVIHINAPNAECTLSAYPNPAINQVTFSVQLTQPVIIHLFIYNSLNVLVKQKDQQGSTGNNVITTNIESLDRGVYNVKVIYGNRVCYSRFYKIN